MRLSHLPAAAFALLMSNAAFAQNFGGEGFGTAICGFIESPIISGIFAVVLIGLILAWVNDMVKGAALEVVKILVGAFAILNIGTVLGWIGMNPICN